MSDYDCIITHDHIDSSTTGTIGAERPAPVPSWRMREDTTTRKALVDADCNVARAAKALGISRQTLYRRMSQLGIIIGRAA